MKRTLVLVVAAAVLGASCSRRGGGPRDREPLRGDAVWLADGIGNAPRDLETTLRSFRCAAAFVPARRLSGGTSGWAGTDLPAPPAPFVEVPIVLVVEAEADPLAGSTEEQQQALGAFLAREVVSALARGAEFGPVAGVHLDVPFSAETVEPLAAALREARSLLANELAGKAEGGLPTVRGVPLTLSLRGRPPSDEKGEEALRALISRTDGLVAFASSGDGAAPLTFTDSLGKPWWVAWDSRTTGTVRKGTGEPAGRVAESLLDSLTEDPRSEFRQELPWNVEGGAAFTLQASAPIRIGSFSLAAGDSVAFVQPSLVELVARLRAAPAGANARGRIVVFGDTSDSGRVFPVAALADLLTGRPAAPSLRAWVDPDEGSRLLRFGAENASPHASAVSRVESWIEVDLVSAHVSDVEPGGFDRWEAYDAKGRAVSPGRATRVRFYETFVAPFERLEPARVRIRGRAPSPCCPVRVRVVAAAGGEARTDWALPGAAPATPAP